MASIPEKDIEAIISSVDIVDIIKDYIPLVPKGKNYLGVCPFHDDHSPSMSVSKEKQIYKCFSCGACGTAFTFVQNYENVSFAESVKIIADKIGYKLDNISINKNTKYPELYQIMDISNMYYKNNLNTNAGVNAKKYLEERQLDDKVIKDFEIGLSLNQKDGLTSLLLKKNFDISNIKELGLVNVDGSNIYDTFVNRIMFPIHDLEGKVVGYTGRIYNNEDLAKYYNSRESKIFKKGELLFNYHRAKEYIKANKEVIIVEGNMDAIRMYSSGFKNTIALMGTSLTKIQIDIIKKLRARVVLMLDNDSSGETATINNGQLLENENVETYVVRLSDYKDPDDYIKNYGYEKMESVIKNKLSFMEYKLFYYKKNKNLDNTNDLVNYVKQIIESIKNIKDNLTKEITLKKLSDEYGIPLETLKNEIDFKEHKVEQSPIIVIEKNKSKYDKCCEAIIYYMIHSPEYIDLYKNNNVFIDNKKYRNIINEILYFKEKYNNISPATFISYVESNDEINEIILNIIKNNNEELEKANFIRYLKSINGENIKTKINNLKQEMKNTLDINKKAELANKIVELKKGSVENERN